MVFKMKHTEAPWKTRVGNSSAIRRTYPTICLRTTAAHGTHSDRRLQDSEG